MTNAFQDVHRKVSSTCGPLPILQMGKLKLGTKLGWPANLHQYEYQEVEGFSLKGVGGVSGLDSSDS